MLSVTTVFLMIYCSFQYCYLLIEFFHLSGVFYMNLCFHTQYTRACDVFVLFIFRELKIVRCAP